MKGTVKILIEDFLELKEKEKQLDGIKSLVVTAVELNANHTNLAVREKNEFHIMKAFVDVEGICMVTGWNDAEIDEQNQTEGFRKILEGEE